MKNTEEEIYKYFGQKVNPLSFTHNRYCGQRYLSVLTIFDHIEGSIFNSRFICEGWCYSNKLKIRSRSNGIAVMLLDIENNNKVWCHISEDYLESLITYVELYK